MFENLLVQLLCAKFAYTINLENLSCEIGLIIGLKISYDTTLQIY